MPFPGRIVAPRNWGLLRSADCGLSKITAGSPPMEIGVDSAAREPALAARGLERCPEEAWTATTAAASTRIKINPCFVIESSFSAENVYLTRSVTNCDVAAIFEKPYTEIRDSKQEPLQQTPAALLCILVSVCTQRQPG